MKFSRDFIEQVRDANNIVSVISQQVSLKRSGSHYMGLCPFPNHHEKTPSFSVSEDKQLYYCFGCKQAGNVFNYLEAIMGMNFVESVEWLAKQAGISVPTEFKKNDSRGEDHLLREECWKINDEALRFFTSQLQLNLQNTVIKNTNNKISSYLKNRNLSDEIIRKFQLGYAPPEWNNFCQNLINKNLPLNVAEKVGLIRKKKDSAHHYYDLFRDRLIFPIIGVDGHCLGFGGRLLDFGEPKYLNSPESNVFHKGRIFYGLHKSAKHIRAQDQAIVVEGYMDFLALYQAGIKNVVAPLGTSFTHEHALLLKRFTSQVVLLFDGDLAGQNAMERSLPLLLSAGLIPRGIILPDDLDPDDFVKQNGNALLKEKIATSMELFFLVLERWMKGFKGSAGEKITLLDRINPLFQSITDLRLKDLYLKELAERMDVEPRWLRNALGQNPPHKKRIALNTSLSLNRTPSEKPKEAPESPVRVKISGKRPKAEEQLVNLALLKPNLMEQIMHSGIITEFSHPGLKEVLSRLFILYRQLPSEFDKLTGSLISQVDAPEVLMQHLENQLAHLSGEDAQTLVNDCIRKVHDTYLLVQGRQLAAQLRGKTTSEQFEKLEQFMNIQLNRRTRKQESKPN